tara:strand:- start:138 stop:971 length:834 start_codon:yes stop_codon:yes gene_type:complete
MDCKSVLSHINEWMLEKLFESKCSGFVIGVSGGIDSAVTSTLAALTGEPVFCLSMPIHQESDQFSRSTDHIEWLCQRFSNVRGSTVNLNEPFAGFKYAFNSFDLSELALANLRSRLRMCSLYAVANTKNYLVVGTGNKVEDHGIGFFTKYGDGGVDISPIADLLKSEVYALASHLGILESIQLATPTDGLWSDNRGDEDQIGATYDELEWALRFVDMTESKIKMNISFTDRQREVFEIYMNRHLPSRHKLAVPPTCYISDEIKRDLTEEEQKIIYRS